MASLRQIAANRRNAEKSTGPRTEEGKGRSRRNALRHGLCAETVIDAFEDSEDYKAFELAITMHYDAQSAVERELVLRLASLLWRVRRATSIETTLMSTEAERLCDPPTAAEWRGHSLKRSPHATFDARDLERRSTSCVGADGHREDDDSAPEMAGEWGTTAPSSEAATRDLAHCFLRLAARDNSLFERLGRYETALWRQVVQTLMALRWARRPFAPARETRWWRK